MTPLSLVRNGAEGMLSPNARALEVLRGIRQPVVVLVVITGPYHTGKSFLMNRLAQRRTGEITGLVRRLMGLMRRGSGCGACRTLAGLTPLCCCWTPRG
uniref:Guanylate-binding protein N-terminal domain-containing protein n=1 Tax=Anser brachyrhynchus TaxID=132585 RepID=A0A8B9BSU1_9AVES